MATVVWPAGDQAGAHGDWTFVDLSGRYTKLTGTFLGAGTSYKPDHMYHKGQPYADKKQRCSRCRWIEVRLFSETATDRYLLVTRGASAVPGETERVTCTLVHGPFQAVEAATTRREEPGGEPFLIRPAAMALAQAAQHDKAVKEAYVNRAVA